MFWLIEPSIRHHVREFGIAVPHALRFKDMTRIVSLRYDRLLLLPITLDLAAQIVVQRSQRGAIEPLEQPLTEVIKHFPGGRANDEIINMAAHENLVTVFLDAPHTLLVANRMEALILQPF